MKHKLRIGKAFIGVDRKQLAKKLNSSQRTVDQYARGLLLVSPKRALLIEKFTKGQFKACYLRPDIFGERG